MQPNEIFVKQIEHHFLGLRLGLWCLMPLSTLKYFSYFIYHFPTLSSKIKINEICFLKDSSNGFLKINFP
jgi:hypothetical protein